MAQLAAVHACWLRLLSARLLQRVAVFFVQLRVVVGRDLVLHVDESMFPLLLRVEGLHLPLAEELGLLVLVVAALALVVVAAAALPVERGDVVLELLGDQLFDVDLADDRC